MLYINLLSGYTFIYLASAAQVCKELQKRKQLEYLTLVSFFDEAKLDRENQLDIVKREEKKWKDLKLEKKNAEKKIYEIREQHPIFKQLFQDLLLTIDTIEFNIIKEIWGFFSENGYRPDFVFITKQTPARSNNCPFVVELQVGKIDEEHIGRVALYNMHILKSSPWREFIISAVTNLETLQLILTKRDKHNDSCFVSSVTIEMDFWSKGINTLIHMATKFEDVGFNLYYNISHVIDNSRYFISKFLGKRIAIIKG